MILRYEKFGFRFANHDETLSVSNSLETFKVIEMREKASEISTDILLDYGYHILISSASRAEQA